MSSEFIKRVLSSLILIPITLFFIFKGSYLFVFFISICFGLIIYEWHMMSKKKSFKIFGFLFLIISFYSIYKLRNNYFNDYSFLLLTTLICVATDLGGYIFGKLFKGPKLTKHSPNKTYSGMIGGFFLSIILVNFFLENSFYLKSTKMTLDMFVYVIFISSVSQLGDIIISYFKRLSKIKDTGKIIPGHGGLLDRVDGMIFAFPISYLILLINLI